MAEIDGTKQEEELKSISEDKEEKAEVDTDKAKDREMSTYLKRALIPELKS